MEISFLPYSPTAALAIVLALLIFFLFRQSRGGKKRVPIVAGAWPVLGHLPLIGASESKLLHKTFGSLADKYGPIFRVNLGVRSAIVVSDAELLKECFTTNDKVLASRPKFLVTEHMGYNYATFGLAPYGRYWRQVRKIVVVELLSHRRLDTLGHIREAEAKSSIKHIYETWNGNKDPATGLVKMEMVKWFDNFTLNTIVTMISGKRFAPSDNEWSEFRRINLKFMELLGSFVISDVIPWLKWLDLGGYQKVMKQTAKDMDVILQSWVDDQRKNRKSGVKAESKKQVFLDVILSLFEDGATEDEDIPKDYDADTMAKALCLTILSGATDTTTVTLTWALTLLVNHPEVLKRAQEELDVHVGRERRVVEADIKNLTYFQAIVKETLRLYPAAPLPAPHESIEDCTIGGYYVPKGTRLIVNLWKLHRNPKVWSEPFAFRPERFLTTQKDLDIWGHHFDLIPFGSGRRICPGITFALQVVQLALASVIQGYDIVRPSEDLVDTTETFGLTNRKATPLEVLLKPRLSPHLYN